MNYGQVMVQWTPLLVALAGMFLGYLIATGLQKGKLKLPTFSKDPRWKNRNKIIDFVAWSIIASGTLGVFIIGLM